MHVDLQIRNTIKLKDVFLCIDFDYALKLSSSGAAEDLYEATTKLI